MSDGYQIVDLAELEAFPYHQRGGQKLLPIQRATGFQPAGINGWIGDAGEPLVPEHAEDSDNEELYVVVSGRATFTVDGKALDAPEGTLIHALPGEMRSASSDAPGTIVVAIGATIGEPFQSGGWTNFVVADALRHDGRDAEAEQAIQAMVDESPDSWASHYNAACFASLAGNADAAFGYLTRAKELATDEQIRGYLQKDSDLDPIREDPRFQELLS
ncbi:MAG TPA: hypothetical protein VGH52_02365 [Gaiellaceae bacterium]|jgi:mannose-6-phosphate isomerase-like protein (cupin superfamily)